MNRVLSHVAMASAGVIAAASIISMAQDIMPDIEGGAFPVAIATSVIISPDSSDGSRVSGTMKKVRDCQILGMEIQSLDPSSGEAVGVIDYVNNFQFRDEGVHRFGPWAVNAPTILTESRMRAVTTHRCHSFWVTRTVFLNTLDNPQRGMGNPEF